MSGLEHMRATLVVNIYNCFLIDPCRSIRNSIDGVVDSGSSPKLIPSNETSQLLRRQDLTLDDLHPYTTRLEKYFIVAEDANNDFPPHSRLLLEVTSQMPNRSGYENPFMLAAEILAGTARFEPNDSKKNDCRIYEELMKRTMAAVCLLRSEGKKVSIYKQDRIEIDDKNMRVRVIGSDGITDVSPFDPYRNSKLAPIHNAYVARALLKKEVKF